MDIIFLKEITLDALIGVYEWERQAPQTIQLDLEIGLPNNSVCYTDNLADTIDYSKVFTVVQQELAQKRFSLLEALAEHIAQLLIKEFGTPWVKISVVKLGIMRSIKKVGVTLERGMK